MKQSSNRKIVLVAGDGFAGRAAMRVLAGRPGIELVVSGTGRSLYLPMLPDLVSGRAGENALVDEYGEWLKRTGGRLVESLLVELDPEKRRALFANGESLEWDYCLLATGSAPAFTLPGAVPFAGLEGARAAASITGDPVTVVGGGYTGVEVASAFVENGRRVILAERGSGILNGLSPRIRRRVRTALEKSGVSIHTGTAVELTRGRFLLDGEEIPADHAVVAAGVRAASVFLPSDRVDPDTGRVPVDGYLRAASRLYAAGDVAGFMSGGRFLRPSVNFACSQGRRAARNLLREAAGRPPKRYRVFDPGFVVPVYSRSRAWGRAFGLPVGGVPGILGHYGFCVLRAFSWKQRLRMLRDLLRFRRR